MNKKRKVNPENRDQNNQIIVQRIKIPMKILF